MRRPASLEDAFVALTGEEISTTFSSVVQPTIYLLAFGLGLGGG